MFDPVIASNAVMWIIGIMTACSIIGTFGALYSMGRAGNRKD